MRSANLKRFNVTITISLENEPTMKTDEIVNISQVLLRPLQRLRDIRSARVSMIGVRDHQPIQLQVPAPGMIPVASDSVHEIQTKIYYVGDSPEGCLRTVVDRWQEDVSSSGPPPTTQTYKAAYMLAEMISKMSTHEVLLDSEINQLVEIVSKARAAREKEDFSSLRNAYEMVLALIEAHKGMQADFVEYTFGLTQDTDMLFAEDENKICREEVSKIGF
jgi:hypothetical protein